MSKCAGFVSPTIVVFFSFWGGGAYAGSSQPPLEENISVSQPPHSPPSEIRSAPSARYYNHYQQLTLRWGLQSGTTPGYMAADDLFFGFQYLLPAFLSPHLEFGADAHRGGLGHIHLGRRWIYLERAYFRPSAKISADHFIDSEKGLSTLANPDHFFLRFSATLEFVLWNPLSLRLEPEYLLNFRNSKWLGSIGLSWGW